MFVPWKDDTEFRPGTMCGESGFRGSTRDLRVQRMRVMRADRPNFRHGTIVARVRGFPSPVGHLRTRPKFPLEYDRAAGSNTPVFRCSTIAGRHRSQENLIVGWGS